MIQTINLLLGAALLVAGRKLFWLFVGVIGFVTGMQLAARFWNGPEWTAILIGIIVGIIFAVLAVFIEALAIGVAGFLAGGFILTTFTSMLGLNEGFLFWILYAIGGLIGFLLVMLLFDWALIILSALAGASLIVQSLFTGAGAAGWIFILLFIVGILIQAFTLQREEHPPIRRYRRVRRVVRHDD
jgi:hypothetical protein